MRTERLVLRRWHESDREPFAALNADPQVMAHFTPAVEIGWRLCRQAWGHGFATEAARQALLVGFEQHGLPEVVSFTARGNAASRAVMRRLGMTHDPAEDFQHPARPTGHRLRGHVLYRLSRAGFDALDTRRAGHRSARSAQ